MLGFLLSDLTAFATQLHPHGWLQHEAGAEGSCNPQMVCILRVEHPPEASLGVLADPTRSWDLGGQPRFRPMWERYCRNVNAIV